MKARGIPGLLGRIAVIGTFVVAGGLWALAQNSPAPGGASEAPERRLLGNVKLLSHTITTTAGLTAQTSGGGSPKTKFTVNLTSSDPACLTGRTVTVSRVSPATDVNASEQSPGVYQTDNLAGRSGTWQATVTLSTYTTYGGETHTCSGTTSNTVTV